LPIAEQNNYTYATVSNQKSPQAKERLAGQLAFVAASLSSKPYLGDQLPVKVNENLYRLDLTGLGWGGVWAKVLKEHYPWRPDVTPHSYPLVVRADVIVCEFIDPVIAPDVAHLLQFGKVLKTGKEFREFHKANTAKESTFGFIEGASGVQSQGLQRLMANYDTAQRTRLFETFDSIVVAGKQDPLEKPVLGTLTYDGAELIAGIPKHYLGEGGALQSYFLANGNSDKNKANHDKAVNEAPIKLVHDTLGLRGFDIRNNLDCISCHTTGMQRPTINAYKQYFVGGAKLYADKATKQELQRVYESPFVKELDAQDADYATAIRLVNGLTPERNAANFVACIKAYDAPVDLAQAAREAYCTTDELRLALGGYAPTGKLSARLAALAEGMPMSRDQWKASYSQVVLEVLPSWRTK
jgi:hypothetical protein